jgi:hypothetical protein
MPFYEQRGRDPQSRKLSGVSNLAQHGGSLDPGGIMCAEKDGVEDIPHKITKLLGYPCRHERIAPDKAND